MYEEAERFMKMTKKQIAALQRMIDREASRIEWKKQNRKEGDPAVEETAGVHPSHEKYIVTDGYVAVIFPEKPAELPEAKRMDSLYDMMRNDIHNHDCFNDHFLALTVTAAHISEWKQQAKLWKAGKTHKTGAVPVKLIAQKPDGGTVEGFYDPRYLVDAVEAIGPSAMLYIGRYSRSSPFCSVLVHPKNWMEDTTPNIGYVLPLRIM